MQAILDLLDSVRLFIGHDYGSEGREEPEWEASVGDQKTRNKHVKDGVEKAGFIKKRKERDATLSLPDRMLAALQINLRAGRLPAVEGDGASYLKIPAKKF